MGEAVQPRTKASYVGVPAILELSLACSHPVKAHDHSMAHGEGGRSRRLQIPSDNVRQFAASRPPQSDRPLHEESGLSHPHPNQG